MDDYRSIYSSEDETQTRYRHQRIAHWDKVAREGASWSRWAGFYHQWLTRIYRILIAPGQRLLELGCSRGGLIAALQPSFGVGVDFSGEMLHQAHQQHPEIHYVQGDAHHLCLAGTFDIIILSDLPNDLWDVQRVFNELSHLCTSRTRLIINFYSRIWELPLALAEKLNLSTPRLLQNWLTVEDITNLMDLTGLEVIRSWQEFLFPLPIPVIGAFFNRFLVRLWPFYLFGLTNFVMARLAPKNIHQPAKSSVSVVIPARNEAGNIAQIFNRLPQMGSKTELVFVEGHSRDDTYAVIEAEITAHPEHRCVLLSQTGTGKGNAIRLGFQHATGDILIILDADLTVPPEVLPRFYEAICQNKGELVNGVRLVYPMERQAMQFFNLIGNKFFSLAFSWLLGQPIKDTLCGTKALWKADYVEIAANRKHFGDFDPFGDFDLLFGATKLNLKIVDLPVRYRERTYGTTNIQRWKHGWLLLRMVAFAAVRFKFV